MKKVKEQKSTGEQKRLARQLALPLRKNLVAEVSEVHQYLLATVSTNGTMGNVTNWQQHIMPSLLTEPGQELAKILGEDLPADAIPSNQYVGPLRIFLPTLRTSLNIGEDLKLKIIILAQNPPKDIALYWRPIGKGKYNRIALTHIARGVYSVKIPANKIKTDLEYYVKASSTDDQQVTFPATAPNINQTVIVSELF